MNNSMTPLFHIVFNNQNKKISLINKISELGMLRSRLIRQACGMPNSRCREKICNYLLEKTEDFFTVKQEFNRVLKYYWLKPERKIGEEWKEIETNLFNRLVQKESDFWQAAAPLIAQDDANITKKLLENAPDPLFDQLMGEGDQLWRLGKILMADERIKKRLLEDSSNFLKKKLIENEDEFWPRSQLFIADKSFRTGLQLFIEQINERDKNGKNLSDRLEAGLWEKIDDLQGEFAFIPGFETALPLDLLKAIRGNKGVRFANLKEIQYTIQFQDGRQLAIQMWLWKLLISHCDYFKILGDHSDRFERDQIELLYSENSKKFIKFEDIALEDFEELLEYLQKKDDAMPEDITSLLTLSNRFGCSFLQKKCETLLDRHLRKENVFSLMKYLNNCPDPVLIVFFEKRLQLELKKTALNRGNFEIIHTYCKDKRLVISELKLEITEIDDKLLEMIDELKIERLDLSNSPNLFTNNLFKLEGLSALKALNLSTCYVTDNALKCLTNLKLESLELNKCDKITDKGLEYIGQIVSLTHLDLSLAPCLSREQITASGLSKLSRLVSLTYLNLNHRHNLGSAIIELLASFSLLKHLHLQACSITDRGLLPLRSLSHLETLDLTSNRLTTTSWLIKQEKVDSIDEPAIKPSCFFEKLEQLGLSDTLITNQDLSCLSNLTSLKHLNLSGCSALTKEGLTHLPKQLKSLNLSACFQLIKMDLSNLSSLSELTHLNLSKINLTDTNLMEMIDKLPGLEFLDLSYCATPKGIVLKRKGLNIEQRKRNY